MVTKGNIIPSPHHNEQEMQNSHNLRSTHTAPAAVTNEPQGEQNVVYNDAPLIKLPRPLQRLANYNKPGLKE